MITTQEIFDKVATHLLTQGCRSVDENGRCMYRMGSLRCAVGCLIEDPYYRPELETKISTNVGVIIALTFSLGRSLLQAEERLLNRLQILHDGAKPKDWKRGLLDTAAVFDLKTDAIGESTS